MEVTYLYLLSQLWLTTHLAVSTNVTQCYWSDNKMFDFNCSNGILKINQVYALSKLKSSNCTSKEQNPLRNDTAVFDECCVYNEEDCMTVYDGVSRHVYLSCMSLTHCEKKRVAHQDRRCGPRYLPDSNYMMIDYDCVLREDILPITLNKTNQANSVLTIASPNFPDDSFPAGEDGVCSVSSSCRTNLTLRALILQLESEGDGARQQYLEVKDNHETVTINCTNNTNHNTFELYREYSNFFIVNFFNTLEKDRGKMWLEVTSSSKSAILDVRCGTSAMTSPSSVPECSGLPQVTTSSHFPGPTDSSRGNSPPTKSSSSQEPIDSSWSHSPTGDTSSSSLGPKASTGSFDPSGNKSSSSPGPKASTWSRSSSGDTSSSSPGQKASTGSHSPTGVKSSSSPGPIVSTGSHSPSRDTSSSFPGPKASTLSHSPTGDTFSSSPEPKASMRSLDPSGNKFSSSPGPKTSTWSRSSSGDDTSSSFPRQKASTGSLDPSGDKTSSSPGPKASTLSRSSSGDTSSSSSGPKASTESTDPFGDKSSSSPGPKASTWSRSSSRDTSSSFPGRKASTLSHSPTGDTSSSSPGQKASTGSTDPSGDKSSSSPGPEASTGSPDPSGDTFSSSPGPKASTWSNGPSEDKSSSSPGPKASTGSPDPSRVKFSSPPDPTYSSGTRPTYGETSINIGSVSGNIPGNSENTKGTGSTVNNINGHGPWIDAGMIGGAAAGVAVACLLLLIAYIIWRHKKKVGTTPEDETQTASNGLPLPLTGGPLPAITVPSSTQGPRLKPDQGQGEQDEPILFIMPTPTHPPPNRLPPLFLQDPPMLPDIEA